MSTDTAGLNHLSKAQLIALLHANEAKITSQAAELKSHQVELEAKQIELESQQAELESQQAELEAHQAELAAKDIELAELREKLRLALAAQYGKRSEKRGAEDDPKTDEFNEAEGLVDAAEAGDEALTETLTYTRKKPTSRGGRQVDTSGLRVECIEHDVTEADKRCACGSDKTRIGEDTLDRVECIPAELYVERHVRPKYACPCCEGDIVQAKPLKCLLPKSYAGDKLLSELIVNKYQYSLPLYRQGQLWQRHGVSIPSNTLASWVIKAAEAMTPLLEALEQQLRRAPALYMDETSVQVIKEPGRSAEQRSYMWVRRAQAPPETGASHGADITLYHYEPSRSADVATSLLRGCRGVVMSDGYAAYDAPCAALGLVHASCWAHARRGFTQAEKALPKGKKSPAISAILSQISKLYGLEKALKAADPAVRQQQRQEKAKPVLDALEQTLRAKQQQVPPKSAFGKAVAYCLNRWPALTCYVDHGEIGIDNNPAENAIRPFVVGRKNWLFAQTPRGAKASAVFYSLIETAKANGVEPYHYLRYVFKHLPRHSGDLTSLLPWKLDPLELAAEP